jgi:hypothetical protein
MHTRGGFGVEKKEYAENYLILMVKYNLHFEHAT